MRQLTCGLIAGVVLWACAGNLSAEDPKAAPIALNPEGTVLLDREHKKVLLKTTVCLRVGVLEMFLCPSKTKEHESILSIDAKAAVIHAALLAAGAKPGRPVRYQPKYQPPLGQQIDVYVNWIDENKKPQRRRAQEWIQSATRRYFEVPLESVPAGVKLDEGDDSLRYDTMNKRLLWFGTLSAEQKKKLDAMSDNDDYRKAVQQIFDESQPRQMQATFVFAGSSFRKLEDGREVYLAEVGSVICVANFPDAMIDVNIESTASNDSGLLFEPWTDRVPPLGTEVTVELIPVEDRGTK
ncbi:YdjY domain-containing protein [Planctomicrobium sp. SH664]|uniref:YdjY domain-containing protein n=1 Tax=Planctomicrobium sp. SH664 TaxID=3448125 RepID=UPI003F5C7B82